MLEEEGWIVKLDAGRYARTSCKPGATASAQIITGPRLVSANMDWYGLYKAQRSLQANWRKGQYTKFELPQRNHASEGHEGDIYALHQENGYVVSGGLDKTIRIWALETRRMIRGPLRGHDQEILCLQFDPHKAEDVIFSGDDGGGMICWRFSTGEIVRRIDQAHDGAIFCLRLNETSVITASDDSTIRIWNRSTFRSQPRANKDSACSATAFDVLRGHASAVNTIACFGDTIVSGSADQTVKVWSITQKRCLYSVREHHTLAAVHFDGQTIATAGGKDMMLYDPQLKVKGKPLPHRSRVRTMQVHCSNESTGIIASGTRDGSVQIWAKSFEGNWSITQKQEVCSETLLITALQLDHRRLLYCPHDNKIEGWDFANGNEAINTFFV